MNIHLLIITPNIVETIPEYSQVYGETDLCNETKQVTNQASISVTSCLAAPQ